MPTVWVRADSDQRSRFHKDANCPQLRKKPARGLGYEVVEVDLADLPRAVPCRTCYPDAPHVRISRRFCPKCNKRSARACAHNGGVPVFVTYATHYQSLLREPGDEITKQIYVWPDRLRFYITN